MYGESATAIAIEKISFWFLFLLAAWLVANAGRVPRAKDCKANSVYVLGINLYKIPIGINNRPK